MLLPEHHGVALQNSYLLILDLDCQLPRPMPVFVLADRDSELLGGLFGNPERCLFADAFSGRRQYPQHLYPQS